MKERSIMIITFLILFINVKGETLTWDGGAFDNTFNSVNNWDNGSGNPTSIDSDDSLVIDVTTTHTISLNANITIGALYLKVTGNAIDLKLDCVWYDLTINGTLTTETSGNLDTDLLIDAGSSTGSVTINNHAYFNINSSTGESFLEGDSFNPGIFIFKGNISAYSGFGSNGTTGIPDVLFDKNGTQTINFTSGSFMDCEDVTIGSSNTPNVVITGTSTYYAFAPYDGNYTIKANCSLDINDLVIDRRTSGGTFTIESGATLKIGGTGDFPANYTTVTINGTSDVYFDGTNQDIDNNLAGASYADLFLEGSGTKTNNSSITINSNLNIDGTATMDIANVADDFNGNILINASGTILSGTNAHTMAGNFDNDGTFTHESGTWNFDGGGTQNIEGDGAITFYNLNVSSSTHLDVDKGITVDNDYTSSGTATLDVTNVNNDFNGKVNIGANTTFLSGSGTHTIAGNFDNDGTFTHESGKWTFDGSATQEILGNNASTFNNFEINNANGITITKGPSIESTLTFTDGYITASTETEPVYFTTAGTHASSGNSSHIIGWATKNMTAADASFTFPVGDGTFLRTATLVMESAVGDTEFNVKYNYTTPTDKNDVANPIHHISHIEYWDINRAGATPKNATITLTWNERSYTQTQSIDDLLVAHYTGTQWESAGGNNISGNQAAGGEVSSNADWSSFSPFTLASSTKDNPLPIELISYNCDCNSGYSTIEWMTTNEIDIEYYIIEGISEGSNFHEIIEVNHENNLNTYSVIDRDNSSTIYQLKEIDIEGNQKLIQNIPSKCVNKIQININENQIEINTNEPLGESTFVLYNVNGQIVFSHPLTSQQNQAIIDFPLLTSGYYFLSINSFHFFETKTLLIR